MHKKMMGTAAALLLSLCIAVGGLCILRVGLEKEERSMLSRGGTVEQTSGSAQEQGEGGTEVRYTESDISLSEEELYQVLKNHEDSEVFYPHEPYYGQLPMDEAVERGEAWIEELKKETGLFSASSGELGKKVSAYLYRPGGEEEMILDSNRIFSIWDLDFYGENFSVSMEMNAVTGQILRMKFYKEKEDLEIQEADIKKLTKFFVSQFELKADGELEEEGGQLVQSLCDGQFYVVEELNAGDMDSYGVVSGNASSYGNDTYEKSSYGMNTYTDMDKYTIDCYITLQEPMQ